MVISPVVISSVVLVAGLILLCAGVFGDTNDREFAIAGAVLIGSWLVSQSINKSNTP